MELLKILEKLESDFKNSTYLLKEARIDPKIHHYVVEIIRNWNKLNFMHNKILRALSSKKIKKPLPKISKSVGIYSIYRVSWEGLKLEKLQKELHRRDLGLSYYYRNITTFDWDIALRGKSWAERTSIDKAIPSFLIETLTQYIDKETLLSIIENINTSQEQSHFTVHLLNIKEELLKSKTDFVKDSVFSNEIYHIPVKFKSKIVANPIFINREVAIHDRASLITAHLIQPQENDLIADFCGAPGMKSFNIAHLSNNTSRIITMDISTNRIKTARTLLLDYHVKNSHVINCDAANPPFRSQEISDFKGFDKILVDAPCTGSGTLSQHPELKWRQSQNFLSQNLRFQQWILDAAVENLKEDGILVYSTCSLYKEEGEEQILRLLTENPDSLKMIELPSYLEKRYTIKTDLVEIESKLNKGMGRTFQNMENTGSYFFAQIQKSKNCF